MRLRLAGDLLRDDRHVFRADTGIQGRWVFDNLDVGILILKAYEARTKNYRKTELWLYLPKEQRPAEEHAQWASATVLNETYLTFARWTAAIAIAMWVLALVFSILGK